VVLGAVVALMVGCSDTAAPANTSPKSLQDRLRIALEQRGTSWSCAEPVAAGLSGDDLTVVVVVYEGASGTSGTITPAAAEAIRAIADC